jgi:hypothetical protein
MSFLEKSSQKGKARKKEKLAKRKSETKEKKNSQS